jgi:RNA polymerase sigma-70 factor (ECF subfamily)
VAQLLPGEPEALGLCALLEHLESRRPAQRTPEGRYVPLDLQDPHRWDGARLARAEQWLREASALGRPGRFQTEAAIQSAHAERRVTGQVDREGVVRLYEALLAMAPTIGARVGYAGALWSAGRPRAALVVLDELPAVAVASFQAHWAVRAHVLLALARSEEADEAFSRAIGLSEDPAVRRHLMGRRAGADPRRALRPLEEIDTG